MATILQYDRSKLPSGLSSAGINAELARKISDSYQQMKVYAKNDAQAAEWLMRDSKKVFGVEISDKGILDAALAYVGKTQGNIASKEYINEERAKNLEAKTLQYYDSGNKTNVTPISTGNNNSAQTLTTPEVRRYGTDGRIAYNNFMSHPERGAISPKLLIPSKQGLKKFFSSVARYGIVPVATLVTLGYGIHRFSPATEQKVFDYLGSGLQPRIERSIDAKLNADREKYGNILKRLDALEKNRTTPDTSDSKQKPSLTQIVMEEGPFDLKFKQINQEINDVLCEKISLRKASADTQAWFASLNPTVQLKQEGSNYYALVTVNVNERYLHLKDAKTGIKLGDKWYWSGLPNREGRVNLTEKQYNRLSQGMGRLQSVLYVVENGQKVSYSSIGRGKKGRFRHPEKKVEVVIVPLYIHHMHKHEPKPVLVPEDVGTPLTIEHLTEPNVQIQ